MHTFGILPPVSHITIVVLYLTVSPNFVFRQKQLTRKWMLTFFSEHHLNMERRKPRDETKMAVVEMGIVLVRNWDNSAYHQRSSQTWNPEILWVQGADMNDPKHVLDILMWVSILFSPIKLIPFVKWMLTKKEARDG